MNNEPALTKLMTLLFLASGWSICVGQLFQVLYVYADDALPKFNQGLE
jgi:hypothetical protein